VAAEELEVVEQGGGARVDPLCELVWGKGARGTQLSGGEMGYLSERPAAVAPVEQREEVPRPTRTPPSLACFGSNAVEGEGAGDEAAGVDGGKDALGLVCGRCVCGATGAAGETGCRCRGPMRPP
jgi:hypothetical protein